MTKPPPTGAERAGEMTRVAARLREAEGYCRVLADRLADLRDGLTHRELVEFVHGWRVGGTHEELADVVTLTRTAGWEQKQIPVGEVPARIAGYEARLAKQQATAARLGRLHRQLQREVFGLPAPPRKGKKEA